MNKKYIDFVPVKKSQPRPKAAQKAPAPEVVVYREEYTTKIAPNDEALDAAADTFSIKRETVLGVVENINPKFVKTDVQKRPLSKEPEPSLNVDELAELKSKKLVGRREKEAPAKTQAVAQESMKPTDTYKMPKSPFINQANVAKRPLSKHVYKKNIEPVKEEKKGPVTIIAKPKKEGKIGLVITIILTIILGAAAGTVAFLLLPK